MEGLTAKVFRTYNASHTLQNELNKPLDAKQDVKKKKDFYDACVKEVAVLCNH
jgi:DNA topoisomerase I